MTKLSFFQIVVLAVFGALAIGGVMIFAFVVGGSGGGGIGEVEIWGTLDASAFSVVLRQLSDEDSRLKQVTYAQKNPETFSRELTDALAAGQGPELFILQNDYAERDGPKVIDIPFESFSQEQFRNTFIEAASPYIGPEGIRGVPFVADPLVMYWNRDLLANAGLAKPPEYWGNFYDMAAKVTVRDDTNAITKSAVALGEYRNINHAKDIIALLIMQAGGGLTARDNTGKLSTALVARAGTTQQPSESAVRFFTEFVNPIKTYYSWNRAQPESRQAFASGDVGVYIGRASEEPLIRRINPNLNFAVASVPQIQGRDRFLDIAKVYAFAIPKTSANPQGALTVAYLLASQKPSQLLSQALGIPSARRDVLAIPVTGNDDLFNKQAIISWAWTDPDPEKTDVIFRDMIEAITSGSAQPAEGIQRADRAMAELMSI